MDTECGMVKEVRGNLVCVAADPASLCATCSSQCMMRQQGRDIWIHNTLDAKVGDRVYFVFPPGAVVLSSGVLYGIPIVLLIAGIVAGTLYPLPFFNDRELSAIVMGIIFLALSFVFIRIVSKFVAAKNMVKPVMVKVDKVL